MRAGTCVGGGDLTLSTEWGCLTLLLLLRWWMHFLPLDLQLSCSLSTCQAGGKSYLFCISSCSLVLNSQSPLQPHLPERTHPVEKLAPTQTNEPVSPESLLKRAGFVQALFRLRLTHLLSHYLKGKRCFCEHWIAGHQIKELTPVSDVDVPPCAFTVPQPLIRAHLPAAYGGAAREPQRCFAAPPPLTQPQDFPPYLYTSLGEVCPHG